MSEILGDEQFSQDLNDYLAYIEYDEKQIHEEREAAIKRILTNKPSMSIISGNL